MHSETYKKISAALKVLAKIVGGVLIFYGSTVGLLGLGPDGPVESISWRLIGLLALSQGVLYFISNSRIHIKLRNVFLYLGATLIPLILLSSAALFSLFEEGFISFLKDGGLLTVVVLVVLSLPAPLSLIFSVLGKMKVEQK